MYEDYTLQYKARKKSKKSKKVLATFAFGFIVIAILFKIFIPKKNSDIVSPVSENENIKETNYNPLGFLFREKKKKTSQTQESLLKELKKIVEKAHGFYSVYIYDLNKNQGFGINETTIIRAASVNKIPVIASLYFLAQTGTIDLDDKITLQAKDIQDFGTGILRYEKPGRMYSLKTLAQLMIKKSDNTAEHILKEQIIGVEKVQELINAWGLTQTDINLNKTSNQDTAQLFTKMYRGHITNQAYTTEMMGFFVDTDFEERIPKNLPNSVKVYHKIGNEVGNIHDVGIIELPGNPYYLGVLTNDIIDMEGAKENISKISKIVFDYYINQVAKREN